VSKRDYGQTTSSLLANQEHRYKRLLSAKDDTIFALSGEVWRLHRLLKEYRYAEEDDPEAERARRATRIGQANPVQRRGTTKREGDPI
jgi:hypothetical protein